ncbi:MAG: DNA mismatch repair endonuclease MutL [Lentisphaerae bacterium]|nr:DNA mismatch repair endonuclease MutL [Lentisphaerota bacterium]
MLDTHRHIRMLPEQVANKIAAGEVVERPASVVKELVENAIDAGARRIEVHVAAGGRKLVEVRDDGCGMGRDDALMSIERQATSKIRDVDDIERISTLGFRGEAIPAIASVSRFILKTCAAGAGEGTELTVIGGRLQDVKAAGFPQGTTVEVRDLFFNVPARRKFLRAYQTEQAHIRTVFTLHALAHPEIGMALQSDGRDVVRLAPESTLEDRIRELFGAEFLTGLRPVSRELSGVAVTGFVGLPALTRSDRSDQYVFINGRPATAPVIAYALREAYPPLDGERKPVVFLFLAMNPEWVDVNVHPTKREVRFRRPADVREAIIEGICAALGRMRRLAVATGTAVSPAGVTGHPSDVGGRVDAALPITPAVSPPPDQPVRDLPLPPLQPPGGVPLPFEYPGRTLPCPQAPPPAAAALPAAETRQPRDDACVGGAGAPWAWCRVIGPVGGLYLLLEIDSGYVVLDPRAAHERVLYERLLARVRRGEALTQTLLLPETVVLPPAHAERLRGWLAVLQRMGFGVAGFGGDTFLVDALPPEVAAVPCRSLLLDICNDLETLGARRGAEEWREDALVRAACAAAVKNDGTLAAEEAGQLVRDLAACRMPYTCPRGRPTMMLTTYRELARKFGRA